LSDISEADLSSTNAGSPPETLWKSAGWRALFAARCISVGGSGLTWLALPVLTYTLTGSSAWTSAVVAADAVPYLILGLLAGHTADAFDRKRIMVIANIFSAAALVTVPGSHLLFGTVAPLHLVIAALALQSGFVFFDAANFGATPTMVGKELVARANAQLYGYTGVIECVVPALGGLMLLVTSPLTLLCLDLLSFLAAALLISRIVVPLSARRPVTEQTGLRPWSSIRQGLAYLWTRSLIRDTTLANLAVSVGTGAVFAQLVVWAAVNHGIHESDGSIGFFFTALSAGAVLGAFASERVARLGSPRIVVGTACLAAGVLGLGAAWSPGAAAALLLLALWQAASCAAMLVGVSLRQQLTPEPLQSRVNTTGRMIALGVGFPVGAFLSGLITTATGRPELGMSCGLVVVLAVWPFLTWRHATSTTGVAGRRRRDT